MTKRGLADDRRHRNRAAFAACIVLLFAVAYAMTRFQLVLDGATRAQVEAYEKACDEAPGRPFNPWSGD